VRVEIRVSVGSWLGFLTSDMYILTHFLSILFMVNWQASMYGGTPRSDSSALMASVMAWETNQGVGFRGLKLRINSMGSCYA